MWERKLIVGKKRERSIYDQPNGNERKSRHSQWEEKVSEKVKNMINKERKYPKIERSKSERKSRKVKNEEIHLKRISK